MVTPFERLTAAGRRRRFHALAAAALADYDLRDASVRFHADDTNLLYRVTTHGGERFMLRMGSPEWRTLTDLESEAMWLDALARDTAVGAPQMLRARNGRQVLVRDIPGSAMSAHVMVMTWVDGRLLGGALVQRNLEEMGRLFAVLHEHGKAWVPPPGFTPRRFDDWLSRGEPDLLAGAAPTGAPASGAPPLGVPTEAWALLGRMRQHVERAYAALDLADLRVIHCDLWHDNIKVDRGALRPIDFEDTTNGFRIHDIAMAMLDLLEATDEATYATLYAAFRRGYRSLLEWPDAPIEPFQVGRLLWKINWVARHEPEWLAQTVERHVPVLAGYEATGRLAKPPV